MVPNTIGIVGKTNSSFIPWSRNAFAEDQEPENGQKLAEGSLANIDQHELLFTLTPNLIGFVR